VNNFYKIKELDYAPGLAFVAEKVCPLRKIQ
jgi:hypothetical protein